MEEEVKKFYKTVATCLITVIVLLVLQVCLPNGVKELWIDRDVFGISALMLLSGTLVGTIASLYQFKTLKRK